jgi:hypothetical protein
MNKDNDNPSKNNGLNKSFLIIVLIFSFLVGTGFIGVNLDPISKKPPFYQFIAFFLFHVFPFWICLLIVYGLLKYNINGRIYFPDKTPKIILLVNLMVVIPGAFAFEMFANSMVKLISEKQIWQTIIAVFIYLIIFSFWGMKHITSDKLKNSSRE